VLKLEKVVELEVKIIHCDTSWDSCQPTIFVNPLGHTSYRYIKIGHKKTHIRFHRNQLSEYYTTQVSSFLF
jgi:hypothetical protein